MIFACPKSPVFSKIILKVWKNISDIGLETLTNGKNPKLPIFSKVCTKLRCGARGLFQVLQKSLIWVKATFWTKAKLEYVVRLIGSDITKTFITNKSIASLDTWSIHNSRHLSFFQWYLYFQTSCKGAYQINVPIGQRMCRWCLPI